VWQTPGRWQGLRAVLLLLLRRVLLLLLLLLLPSSWSSSVWFGKRSLMLSSRCPKEGS
jgi:hypothetical protein